VHSVALFRLEEFDGYGGKRKKKNEVMQMPRSSIHEDNVGLHLHGHYFRHRSSTCSELEYKPSRWSNFEYRQQVGFLKGEKTRKKFVLSRKIYIGFGYFQGSKIRVLNVKSRQMYMRWATDVSFGDPKVPLINSITREKERSNRRIPQEVLFYWELE
jgi:hypothetical protein